MKLPLMQLLRALHFTTPTNSAETTHITQQINSMQLIVIAHTGG